MRMLLTVAVLLLCVSEADAARWRRFGFRPYTYTTTSQDVDAATDGAAGDAAAVEDAADVKTGDAAEDAAEDAAGARDARRQSRPLPAVQQEVDALFNRQPPVAEPAAGPAAVPLPVPLPDPPTDRPADTPPLPEQAFPDAPQLTPVELSLLRETNAARASHGLPPLSLDAALLAGARLHAKRMAANGSLWHPRGVAENVASGQPTPRSVVHQAWMRSSGHRANILGRYTLIGVAAAVQPGSDTVYWCQRFR